MKRQLTTVFVVFMALAILLVGATTLLVGATTSRISHLTPVYYVIPSDSDTTIRRRGLNVVVLDGSADNVPFQALIDKIQAISGPQGEFVIGVAPGSVDLDVPLYIGYSGTQPNQNEGVTIIGLGQVRFKNSGGQMTDQGKFMMYFCPASGSTANLHNLFFAPTTTMAGGLYTDTVHDASKISDIWVSGGEVAGCWFNRSWLSRYEGIRVEFSNAIAIGFSGLNAGHAKALNITLCDEDNMANGVGGVVLYDWDASSGTFYPGEEVKLTDNNGAQRGVLLTSGSDYVIIGHGDQTRFVENDVIYGDDSGATVTVDATITDIGCALFAEGSGGTIDGVNIENNIYADDDASTDYPLILNYSRTGDPTTGVHLRNIRFEAGNAGYARKQANTYIRCVRTDGIIIDGVSVGGGITNVSDSSVAVAGQGDATSDITSVTTGITDDLVAGDKVYLWSGSANDGEYTVEAGTIGSGTFSITDGDFTDADTRLFPITMAARRQPEVLIDLRDVTGARIRSVQVGCFDTALVKIDSNCLRTNIRDVWDWTRRLQPNEDFWLFRGKSGDIISDLGGGTMFVGTKIPDYGTLQYVAKTGIEEITESNGIYRKTTLILQETTTITDAGAGNEGWGTEVLYTFPEGHVLILGVVLALRVDATVPFDSGNVIADNAAGDFAIGTAAITDETAFSGSGTDEDIISGTATLAPILLASGVDTLNGFMTASTQFDGTGGAKTVNANILFDAGTTTATTTIGLKGTVTIHWIDLGDY